MKFLMGIQFDLTCENENEVALSNSAYMVGMLIGSCVLGTLADMYESDFITARRINLM